MEGPEGLTLSTLAVLLALWSLVGRRAERWGITAPMAFIVAGMLLGATVGEGMTTSTVHWIAEVALVLVLFHDASTVRLAALRRDPWIAVRLLAVGFPLAVLLTAGVTLWILPTLGMVGAFLVAAALSATDAGLGAQTVLNPVVPMRVRRALNVESGLNDGLATPIVMVALGVLATEVTRTGGVAGPGLAIDLPSGVLGCVLGVGLGSLAALAVDRSRKAGWSGPRARGLAVLTVPLLTFGISELIGANVFLAAFTCGLAFGRFSRTVEEEGELSGAVELVADILGAILWFLAGGLVIEVLAQGFDPRWLVLAVLALTVLRVAPVALALLGTGFTAPTVLFLGWFGPRGVATIVFGLLTAEVLHGDPRGADIAGVFSMAVVLSVFAHGLSAPPLSTRYANWATRTGAPINDEPSVEPLPSRGRRV